MAHISLLSDGVRTPPAPVTGALLRRAFAIFGGWTLYGLFGASHSYLSRINAGRGNLKLAFLYDFVDAYLWALLTPLVFWIARRMVIRGSKWWWTAPGILLTGALFALLQLGLLIPCLPWMGYRNSPAAVRNLMVAQFHAGVLTCWAIIGLRHAMEYYDRYRTRELVASQLEVKLAVARLEVLKMQLQPHFLFNTLHAISALTYRDAAAADRMIARLSDFLRLTLDSAGVQQVTLRREIEYLDKYLDIEAVRFGDRLTIRREVQPEALDLLVPNLVLQPLVENAVRHGIAPRSSGGVIEISARRGRDFLQVEVIDDGTGPSGDLREGVGVSNTRARLEHLYGARATLELGAAGKRGFRAAIRIPALEANP